jgi:hypothetical protein
MLELRPVSSHFIAASAIRCARNRDAEAGKSKKLAGGGGGLVAWIVGSLEGELVN